MYVSNATYAITFEVPRCITKSTQHYLRTRFFNIGGTTDHSIIKYKYHRLGGIADHNITKYHRLGGRTDHNIIKYHSLGGRVDHIRT